MNGYIDVSLQSQHKTCEVVIETDTRLVTRKHGICTRYQKDTDTAEVFTCDDSSNLDNALRAFVKYVEGKDTIDTITPDIDKVLEVIIRNDNTIL